MVIKNGVRSGWLLVCFFFSMPLYMQGQRKWDSLSLEQRKKYKEIRNKMKTPQVDVSSEIIHCEPWILDVICMPDVKEEKPGVPDVKEKELRMPKVKEGECLCLLHHAIRRKNHKAIEALIKRDPALVNQTCSKGTPLTIAFAAAYAACTGKEWSSKKEKEYEPIILFLIQNGTDITVPLFKDDYFTILHAAAGLGFVQSVQAIISRGIIDINSKTKLDNTPLDIALQCHQEESVKLLIDNNAIIQKKTLENFFSLADGDVDDEIRIAISETAQDTTNSSDLNFKKKGDGMPFMVFLKHYVKSLSANDPHKKILEEKLQKMLLVKESRRSSSTSLLSKQGNTDTSKWPFFIGSSMSVILVFASVFFFYQRFVNARKRAFGREKSLEAHAREIVENGLIADLA